MASYSTTYVEIQRASIPNISSRLRLAKTSSEEWE